MAPKPGKEKKSPGIPSDSSEKESAKKASSKPPKKEDVDDDDDFEDDDVKVSSSKKAGKVTTAKKGKEDDEDEDVGEDTVDDWDKVEEEEEWDPDFEEFDVPKSKGKKSSGVAAKKGIVEDEDFKVDDEFKDLFEGGDELDDDDNDDY